MKWKRIRKENCSNDDRWENNYIQTDQGSLQLSVPVSGSQCR